MVVILPWDFFYGEMTRKANLTSIDVKQLC